MSTTDTGTTDAAAAGPAGDGPVVVVTGAARGVGAELARQLTARGARLALLGLEPTELARVSGELPGSHWWELDVTDAEATQRVAAEVQERFGRVDVVVANAGIGAGGFVLDGDPAAWERVLEVNLLGSVRTVRAFLPAVVASRGYVLQVASVAALAHAPAMSAYCASKAGVEAFAHSLAAEVHHRGVDVGVAYLSWTDTEMVRGADRLPGLRDLRAGMPGLLGKTYPLEPSVARIVTGIEHRRRHVYAQSWLRVLPHLRGVIPALAMRRTGDVAAHEAALGQADLQTPLGAGGAADAAAARVPHAPPTTR